MRKRFAIGRPILAIAALACGALLALGAGVAQAGYVESESFPTGHEVLAVAIDGSMGSSAGDLYAAEHSGVAQFGPPPLSSATTAIATFGEGIEFSGVAVDPASGLIYALNSSAGEVDVFEPAGGSTTTPIATFGAGTITPGDNARIWVDPAGDVFVPDNSTNVIDVFTPAAEPDTWTTSTIGLGYLNEPSGVAVESTTGTIYVLDSGNARVAVFSRAGTFLGELAGPTSPSDFTLDAAGDLFVVSNPESGTQVEEFGPSTGSSRGDFTPGARIGQPFGSGELNGPNTRIAVAEGGSVYLTKFSLFGPNEVLIFTSVASPTATTGGIYPPAELTATTAAIQGTINPNGSDTHWYFEYGLTTSYGQDSPALPGIDAGSEAGSQPVSLRNAYAEGTYLIPRGNGPELSGLEPNATYHYQLIATSQNGTGEGGDQTFTTLPAPPTVHGESSSAVSRTTASVAAEVNPNNEATSYQFQYGTDTGYSLGASPSTPESVGAGYGNQPETGTLSGLQPNTLYYFRVVATNATGATDGLAHTFKTAPDAPAASTGPPSAVGATSGTLAGTVDPEGSATSYYFEYSGPGVLSMIDGELGEASGATTVTAPVAGLAPGSTYEYRLIATNAGGTTTGAYQTLTTQPLPPDAPPAVTTDGSSNIEPSAARVNGTIDPNGGATTYRFEYGTTNAYGASAPAPEATLFSSSEPETVSLTLGGLAPGSVYHYRLVATNADGAAYGADQTFATAVAAVSVFGPPPMSTLAPKAVTRPIAPKPLTRAQKLTKALKACAKRPKKRRAACVKQAKKQYGTPKKIDKRS